MRPRRRGKVVVCVWRGGGSYVRGAQAGRWAEAAAAAAGRKRPA